MPQSPEFSVIIPTYNRLNFLEQAANSVWNQTYCDYEVIIVDDGSDDGTLEYLAKLGNRVKALHQPNKGAGAARNLGVRNAVGNYIAFLDSDDVWFPWTLETFIEAIRTHYRPSLISGATAEFQNSLPNIKQGEFKAEYFADYFETAVNPAYVGSGALVVRRDLFDEVHGFDEGMVVAEDLDFYLRTGTCRDFVRVQTPLTLGYRRHPGNVSTVLAPLYSGAVELLTREKNGRYPGGKARQKERWTLLSRAIRPIALSCLKNGSAHEAWCIYREAFLINLQLGRFRFLVGFLFHWIIRLRLGGRNP